MVRAPSCPYGRAMSQISLLRTSIGLAMALAGVCVGAAPALATVSDGTSNTIQVAVAPATIGQAHSAISHGTQVGSEGIIAILIGLLH